MSGSNTAVIEGSGDRLKRVGATILNGADQRKPIYLRIGAYGHFGRRPDEDGAWLGVAITALSRRPLPLLVTHLIRIRECTSRAFNFADNTGDRLLDHVCNGSFDRRFQRWG